MHKTSIDNAEAIINGDTHRTERTDDNPNFSKNDPVSDHVEVNKNKIVDGSASQMKFVSHPEKLIDNIAKGSGGGKNDLSRYRDVKLDLPSDQVDKAKKHCEKQIEKLKQQAEKLKQQGNAALANKKIEQAKNYKKILSNIRDCGISTEQSILLRKHPLLATTIEIGKTSHRAGVQGLKTGSLVGGVSSVVRNVYGYMNDDLDGNQAVTNVIGDTAKSAAFGYVTAASGAALKSVMEQASPEFIRDSLLSFTSKLQANGNFSRQYVEFITQVPEKLASKLQILSKTSLPNLIVSTVYDVSSSLSRYFSGKIDGNGLCLELGEKGVGALSGSWGAIIGQAAIPIPVFGAIAGSLIASSLSSICYGCALHSLEQAQIAKQEYEIARDRLSRSLVLFEQNKQILVNNFESYYEYIEKNSIESLQQIEESIFSSNINDFEHSSQRLAHTINTKLTYGSYESFKQGMSKKR